MAQKKSAEIVHNRSLGRSLFPLSKNMKGGILYGRILLLFSKRFLRNSGIIKRIERMSLLKLKSYLSN
jgi:hypothetical protein